MPPAYSKSTAVPIVHTVTVYYCGHHQEFTSTAPTPVPISIKCYLHLYKRSNPPHYRVDLAQVLSNELSGVTRREKVKLGVAIRKALEAEIGKVRPIGADVIDLGEGGLYR